jgi:subtilisin-like proprotein convertase family protein
MSRSILQLIFALIAAFAMSCTLDAQDTGAQGMDTQDTDTQDTDTHSTVAALTQSRCATDILDAAQAIARVEWVRKCSLILNTAGTENTFTSERGAIISGGTLVGAPDYVENTSSKAYTGNINNFEINFSYGFSRYTSSIYTAVRDPSGPTANFWRWSQPSTNQRVRPLYPVFDNNTAIDVGTQLFPNPALLDTTSLTRWQTVDCGFFQKDAATGAFTAWPGNFFVSAYCEAVCNALNGTFNSTDVPKAIPDADFTGITSILPVAGTGNVGSLKLSLNITHTFIGDLLVTLIAPDGRQFVVSNLQGGATANLVITNQSIPGFYGHVAAGTWKLKVQDLAGADVGTLNSWSLAIVGNCNPVVNWSGSATPNIATVDNGTVCTSLNVPTTGGDPSLASLNLSGRHDFCASLSGTLTHNGVTVTAFPVGAFPFALCTFNVTGSVPGMSGDTAGTWTLCITDNDAFGDTGVLNSWSVHN